MRRVFRVECACVWMRRSCRKDIRAPECRGGDGEGRRWKGGERGRQRLQERLVQVMRHFYRYTVSPDDFRNVGRQIIVSIPGQTCNLHVRERVNADDVPSGVIAGSRSTAADVPPSVPWATPSSTEDVPFAAVRACSPFAAGMLDPAPPCSCISSSPELWST